MQFTYCYYIPLQEVWTITLLEISNHHYILICVSKNYYSNEKTIPYLGGEIGANGSFMKTFMQTMIDHLLLWLILSWNQWTSLPYQHLRWTWASKGGPRGDARPISNPPKSQHGIRSFFELPMRTLHPQGDAPPLGLDLFPWKHAILKV